MVNLRIGSIVCHLFSHSGSAFGYARQVGKAGGLQILRWQGLAVKCYGCTLAAVVWAEPSDFCNDGVKQRVLKAWSDEIYRVEKN